MPNFPPAKIPNAPSLYNGNISSMALSVPYRWHVILYNYKYDQLNRLVSMNPYQGFNKTTNNWSGINALQTFKERYSYDANRSGSGLQR